MNKSPESQSPKLKAIRSRWLACTQSTGRVGKSTAAEGIITWLRYAGVAYAAYDADGEHRTLSSRYPDDVEKFDAANSPEEFSRLLERISEDFPVTLVDFPAQATRFLLSSVEHFRLVEIFGRRGIRPTLLIFAADDSTAMASASKTIGFFDSAADYILIENPARFSSVDFRKTRLAKWFEERHAPTIVIPPVLDSTMRAWVALERKLKRYLPLDEACNHPELSDIKQGELQFLRDRFCAQCEEHAERLLPEVSLIKTRMPKGELVGARREINPLEDPLY